MANSQRAGNGLALHDHYGPRHDHLVHPALRPSHSHPESLPLRTASRPRSAGASPRSLRDAGRNTPPDMTRERFGLPPTPPTLTNSDVAEPRGDSLALNPKFADAVRNALNSQHSSDHSTPTSRHLAPHTPDPTPPTSSEQSKSKPPAALVLLPSASPHPRSSPSLGADLSSRAESFHTALESARTSQTHLAHEPSPPESPLAPEMTLPEVEDFTVQSIGLAPSAAQARPLSYRKGDNRDEMGSADGTITPESLERISAPRLSLNLEFSDHDMEKHLREMKLVSDSPLIRRIKRLSVPTSLEPAEAPVVPRLKHVVQPPESPLSSLSSDSSSSGPGATDPDLLQPSHALRHFEDTLNLKKAWQGSDHSIDFGPPSGDMDKHITYIEDEAADDIVTADVVAEVAEPKDKNPVARVDRSLQAPELPAPQISHESSAEDVNNDVYREIREKNVKRHSGGGLPVGIIVPSQPVRKLKRVSRCDFLRETASEAPLSQRNSIGTPPRLRHKKAVLTKSLENSPQSVEKPQRRYVSAPEAQLSGMTALTRGALESVDPTEPLEAVPKVWQQNTLRRASREARLESQDSISHGRSLSSGSKVDASTLSPELNKSPTLEKSPVLRAAGPKESPKEPANFVPRTSLEVPSVTSGSIKSPRKGAGSFHANIEPGSLLPSTTPVSTSQFSYRTDVELCEARGVSFFPVTDDGAVQVVHQAASRPLSRDHDDDDEDVELHFPIRTPPPDFQIRKRTLPPEPNPIISVDSPLINPRAAPEPPVFRFIAPTPSNELDRVSADEEAEGETVAKRAPLKRGLSLKDRARRYSESYIVPLFTRSTSVRRSNVRPSTADETRPAHLSPMWRPRYFWEDYDSDESYDEDEDDDFEGGGRTLPPGGDTSDVTEGDRAHIFPRNMSVRMPGFRGTGGFLVGNSLGLDRHGTNNRRHYIIPARRTSDEGLRRSGSHRRAWRGGKDGNRLEAAFRNRLPGFKAGREHRAREKRMQSLRENIQHHVEPPPPDPIPIDLEDYPHNGAYGRRPPRP